jgi:transglutaminase-like putative cysteine protease
MLLLPVMLCSILLFQTNPRQEFDKQPETVLEYIRTHWLQPLLEKMPTFTVPTFTAPNFTLDPDFTIGPDITMPNVDLQFVGPKQEQSSLVMKVTTDHTGTLYLRGKSYGDYDGLSWSASPIVNDSLELRDFWTLDPLYLQIRTARAYDLYYIAYYPTGKAALQDGRLTNTSQATEYDLFATPLREDWQDLYLVSYPEMTAEVLKWVELPDSSFTALPSDTQARAEALLREYGIHSGQHILDIADIIQHQVRESAVYSLNTPYMPSGETDFAMWFLENSDTGYCIHFATAATVLLRAAGIPARYVEGYMTQVNSSGIARVTQDQAHAWVEYWVPKVGWVIMDPTPADNSAPPVTTTPTEPTTRPTVPTTQPTVPTTRPTEPTEPTPPTTKPTNPTVPTPPTTTPTNPTEPTPPTTGPTSPTDPTAPTTSTAPTTQTTQPPSVPPTTSPDTQDPERPKADLTWLWIMLQSLLVLLLAAGALIGQWWLRLYLRKKWLCHGSSNAQALRRWRYAKRMARLRRQDAPAALKELALKAKFSQHTISDEELAAFDGYFARSVTHLKSRPIWLRLVYRLVFAAY